MGVLSPGAGHPQGVNKRPYKDYDYPPPSFYYNPRLLLRRLVPIFAVSFQFCPNILSPLV